MAEHESEPAARSRCLPKYTLFLSHSGNEKGFTDQLCEDFRQMNHYPFLVQDSDSLPKGEKFASLVFSAAERCLLAVVVLSEGYLSSKWSMLELSTFVKSRKATNPNLRLFPLFYKLSRSDLCAEKVETIWRASWEKLVEEGKVPAEEISSWSDAVCELRAFNGLEYRKHKTSKVKYRAAVVREVYNNVPPIQHDLQIPSRMFEEGTSDYICMERCYDRGLYGFGGVGKSSLQRINHFPFLDRHPNSLPRGPEFASTIFSAAEECLMALGVLSEGYLRSKRPMLELSALMKSGKATNLVPIPLFYTLSPSDLCLKNVETEWRPSWEKLVENGTVSAEEIGSWSDAVRELRAIDDGLVFSKFGMSEVKCMANTVCSVAVDRAFCYEMKYSADNIGGYERLCEIPTTMFEEGISDYICREGCHYLGLCGLGGVGESTLFRAMCSYFQAKTRMRVCHVELPRYAENERSAIENRDLRLKLVLQELTDIGTRSLDRIVTESQESLSYLKDQLSSQPVFIAVDNVGDSESSLDEARRLVMAVLASGSKVMVTSRSRPTLRSVISADHKYCKPTPRLELVEAYEARESFLPVAAPKQLLCQPIVGRDMLEAELHVIDMVNADIPLDLEATKFEVIKECMITLVQGIEAQVVEFSRLHSGNHIQVFNHECESLVHTLSRSVRHRICRYNNTLSVVQVAGVSDRRRIFMSVAFCIVALTELERMFKAVVDLLASCSKKEWWHTALELSNALPSPTIPRWSSFSLAIRSCEWSMDIVDLGFHALEQFLAGASTVTGVVFKWSDKQSRMVLHIDGKPLYHDEGGSSLLHVTRDLEGKDVKALIQKLVDLIETPRTWFSWIPGFSCFPRFSSFPGFSWFFGNKDTNMHIIANILSQKLHGPRPEPNSLPYTFRVKTSTLKYVKHIGTGGFGCVAEFEWLGRKVSVKKVKSPGLSRKQFEEEAAILATVQHPRVVRMIGCAFEENEGTGSLVMELMEGDLRDVIAKRCPKPARGVSPFPLRVAIDIMLQIGEGMQYLREHRILHRDLKAKNVLLNRCRTSECGASRKFPDLASVLHTEEYYIVKLADFGIAKAGREQTNFGTRMAGTTSWMAPEVYKFSGAHNYEWRADVYSFAMTCYEILTGCVPFHGVRTEELYKRIVAGERPPLDDVRLPPLLKDLVERCWKTDPNERPNFDEICKTLWQCKVENILPAFELQIGPSQAESV